MKFLCPVCGYPELALPPTDFTICPSCGTEFGNDDFTVSVETLRTRWLTAGAPWWSEYDAKPSNWNPWLQVLKVLPLKTNQNVASQSVTVPAIATSLVKLKSTTEIFFAP